METRRARGAETLVDVLLRGEQSVKASSLPDGENGEAAKASRPVAHDYPWYENLNSGGVSQARYGANVAAADQD